MEHGTAKHTPKPIRVMAVDDHPVLRSGIDALIGNHADIHLVAEASSGTEAVEQFRSHRPDVTLMDLRMPGLSGVEAIQTIRKEFPNARIIVLTAHAGDVLARNALKVGASAYVLKSEVRKELVETIRAVHKGLKRVHVEVAVEMAAHTGEELLTPREVEVLRLAASGLSNKRIAAQLQINIETAKSHMKNVLDKLGAHDRTHAVTLSLKRGIIEL